MDDDNDCRDLITVSMPLELLSFVAEQVTQHDFLLSSEARML